MAIRSTAGPAIVRLEQTPNDHLPSGIRVGPSAAAGAGQAATSVPRTFETCQRPARMSVYQVDRKSSAHGQNDAIDPKWKPSGTACMKNVLMVTVRLSLI
jgi:hypothetical protein